MTRVALTLRIDADQGAALENLSRVEGRPVDQLLDEAIASYLSRRRQNEPALEANLAALREYRKQDPGFERAIEAFVEAEATLDDPIEGEPVDGHFINGEFKPGPVQAKIRDLLGA